jgi:hypothetical protein
MVRSGIPRPMVGAVAGTKYPVIRANGTVDGSRGIGGRTVFLAGGVSFRGRGSPHTGSGVPAAGPLTIRSQIGEARLGAGVILNQLQRQIPRARVSIRHTISHTAGPEPIAIGAMLTKDILFCMNILTLAGFAVMGLTLTLNRMGQAGRLLEHRPDGRGDGFGILRAI